MHSVVKDRLLKMQETNLSVEETLSIAELVDSDPVINCLVKIDQKSWQELEDLFTAFSIEDKRKKFMHVSDMIEQDPIVKGKCQAY